MRDEHQRDQRQGAPERARRRRGPDGEASASEGPPLRAAVLRELPDALRATVPTSGTTVARPPGGARWTGVPPMPVAR